MPPFSPYREHQDLHYSNVGGSDIFEETIISRQEGIDRDEGELNPGVSDKKLHHYQSNCYSAYNGISEEKYHRHETKKLSLDSLLDSFEENYHEEVKQYLHPQHVFPRVAEESVLFGYTNGSLSTIPERRVVFAGKLYGGAVFDDVEINLIPHLEEYTSEDKRNMWYTKDEFKAMRESSLHAALIVSKNSELYCPYFLRGLEHLVEDYVDYHRSIVAQMDLSTKNTIHEKKVQNQNYDHCRDSSSTAGSRRFDSVEAVLCEQDEQRMISLKKYGVYYGGVLDSEKIRSVYTIEGKTKISQSIAHANASRDEACAREWLMGEKQHVSAYHYDEDADHCHQIHTCSDELSKAVGWVFRNLLMPFIDIPNGDIYSQMGDEFFLAYS